MGQKEESILFCYGGGCTAKLGPKSLEHVLAKLPKQEDEHVLVGFDHSDDSAVYQLTDDLAIVQSVDFFPPMVEDPYVFGQIAAANALSDIYACGGDAKTALNLVCFPEEKDLNLLGKILLGGLEKVKEAGGVLVGGHSIQDNDVKYGLSVTGTVHPDHILKNSCCQTGDCLILTKPLGVGIVCTAKRVGSCSQQAYQKAIQSMTTINRWAAEILKKYEVHSCTDITGFGLIVHLLELLGEKNSAVISWDQIPYIKECEEYIEEFYITGAAQRNRNFSKGKVQFDHCSFVTEELLFDPQTSGGLLASVAKQDAKACLKEIQSLGLDCGMIGTVIDHTTPEILIQGKVE